jgi:hypothetical protein
VLLGFPPNADAEITTHVQRIVVVFILYPIRIWQPIGRMPANKLGRALRPVCGSELLGHVKSLKC